MPPRPHSAPLTARSWLARHSRSVIFLAVVLCAVGAYLAFTIPIAVFPATNFPHIVIGVDNGVMPIDQMLVTITRPIEEAVSNVPGLRMVQSITSRGSDEVDLFFNWNVDMFQTLQRVNAALARAQGSLPATAQITATRLRFSSYMVFGYSLTSRTMPQTELWQLATYDLAPQLNRLDGVATVVVQGGQVPEFAIQPDPAKLLAAAVTVPQILQAVDSANTIQSPGLLEHNHQLYLGLVTGQVHTPEEIANIVVKTAPDGAPVRIGDVATVTPSVKPVYTVVTANGQPAVLLNINRQPGSNIMAVGAEIHAKIRQLQASLPPGVVIQPFYDQSLLVGQSIGSVRDAIVIGLLLASIVMVVFLRDWGTSLVAGLVIPATLLITMIFLKVLGQTFNLMTLGGLAAAVGLVIDDAIVVVENIVLHREAGEGRWRAVQSAIREIGVALVGSTLTPIVVFLPLVAITGVTGAFFRALAITMSVALLTSLGLALTWTPTLSLYFIRRGADRPDSASAEGERLMLQEPEAQGFFGRVVRFYEGWLIPALRKPKWLALGSAVLVAVSILCYKNLGSDLLPKMDEGAFTLDYVMPAGSSLAETNRVIGHIERILHGIPEVESTSRRTGLQLGFATVTEANTGDISVKLRQHRSRSVEQVIAQARREISAQEPEIDVEFIQQLQDMIGDLTNAAQPIEIRLFSPDVALLNQWAPRVADTLANIPGHHIVDVQNGVDNTISGPAVVFRVDPARAARAGFTPDEVATDATAILQGVPAAAPVVTGNRAYTIRVRFPAADRASLDDVRNVLLTSGSGRTATLGSLATVTELPPQTEILQQNLQTYVLVTARLENEDLGSAMASVRRAVEGMHLPPGIRVEYGGQYASQQRSFRDLLTVLLAGIVLVFLVLLFEFGDWSAPLAILASALLSTSGVLFALWITRVSFNIASFMGLIMVVGIVAKNGILLLDADQKYRGQGEDAFTAIVQAGRRRLRPIAMTAMAAVAGMLPLALGWGAGAQMLQPLAIAVIGGIVISMALSLIVTPAVHFYMSAGAPPAAPQPPPPLLAEQGRA
ncbi:MAG TPA: efflux RND transporter permease subunit [Terriglobales bacterium]|nr:efflux RND transporter permease subunit [Terriglobales bacterium]